MSTKLHTINDVLLLPELTNKMFFNVINFLNEQCSLYSKKAVIISNPCGAAKPCCIIISRDPDFIKVIVPLQERFPDRFSIQNGVLGEFTGNFEKNEIKHPLPGVILKKFDDVAVSWNTNIKPCIAFRHGDKIFVLTTFHVIDVSVNNYCITYMQESCDLKALIGPKTNTKKKQYVTSAEKSDWLATLKNNFYETGNFFVSLFDYSSKGYTSEFSCKVERVDFQQDTTTLVFDLKRPENAGFENWCQTSTLLSDDISAWGLPRVGEWCSTPEEPDAQIKIESIDERVFFPIQDKVTMLRNIIVLSGCQAKQGSSGAPVYDSTGKLVGMIVGRSNQDGEYKYLAVSIAPILAQMIAEWKLIEGTKSQRRPSKSQSD